MEDEKFQGLNDLCREALGSDTTRVFREQKLRQVEVALRDEDPEDGAVQGLRDLIDTIRTKIPFAR